MSTAIHDRKMSRRIRDAVDAERQSPSMRSRCGTQSSRVQGVVCKPQNSETQNSPHDEDGNLVMPLHWGGLRQHSSRGRHHRNRRHTRPSPSTEDETPSITHGPFVHLISRARARARSNSLTTHQSTGTGHSRSPPMSSPNPWRVPFILPPPFRGLAL